jgi:hypothetical protein
LGATWFQDASASKVFAFDAVARSSLVANPTLLGATWFQDASAPKVFAFDAVAHPS